MALRYVLLPVLTLSIACTQNEPAQPAPAAQTPAASATTTAPAATEAQPAPTLAAPPPTAERLPDANPSTTPIQAAAPTATKPAPGTSSSVAPRDSARVSESPASTPPPKPVPQFREVTIPAGTALTVRLSTAVASDKSAVEDEVRGTVTTPIVVDGLTAVPSDSVITGSVLEARRSGRVKGRAAVAFRFDRLNVRDESHTVRTARIAREAEPNRKDDVKKGAIGGVAGAIIGGIAGGGKGAAIGAGIGGAGTVMATRGDEVELPAGTTVRTTLQEALKVVVPLKNER